MFCLQGLEHPLSFSVLQEQQSAFPNLRQPKWAASWGPKMIIAGERSLLLSPPLLQNSWANVHIANIVAVWPRGSKAALSTFPRSQATGKSEGRTFEIQWQGQIQSLFFWEYIWLLQFWAILRPSSRKEQSSMRKKKRKSRWKRKNGQGSIVQNLFTQRVILNWHPLGAC